MEREVNYAKLDSDYARHHARFERRVAEQKPRLTCQDCGGAGGYTEPVLDDGSGPWFDCGWCEGTGLVTPRIRGLWLKSRRQTMTAA